MKKILIIDDDTKLNNLLKNYLSQFNFNVSSETTPSIALKNLKIYKPDLIILDIMLPEIDGFELCKKIREEYNTPTIMLSARGEVTDRIVGLELGADDYMTKPFEPRELLARIQSILRRSDSNSGNQKKNDKILKIGSLELNFKSYTATIDSRDIDLTSMEFTLLALLARNPDNIFTRDMIYERLKGLEDDSYDRSIDVMISRIRQKLGDNPQNPIYVKTVWGTGYKFIGGKE